MKDLYYILGTNHNCTPAQLNAAYRMLAQKLQPPGQAPDRFLDDHFREITNAYQTLSDPVQRRRYDNAFKRTNQRWMHYFSTRHINIAVTLALLVFTGVFGMYVMKAVSGRPVKKIIKPQEQTAVIQIKRIRRKHTHIRANPVAAARKPPGSVIDIGTKPAVEPATTKAAPPVQPIITPVPQVVQRAATSAEKPAVLAAATTDDEQNAVYTAYLKANATGVVYLHSSASYRSAVVANIPNNTKVTVMEKAQGFAKVNFNGQTGYVPGWTVEQ